MISVDFSACFEWLNEDRQSHGLGLTPNFGLTGYKTHYLLYYGGRERVRESERETRLEESEAREKKNERKGLEKGKIGEALQGDRRLTL